MEIAQGTYEYWVKKIVFWWQPFVIIFKCSKTRSGEVSRPIDSFTLSETYPRLVFEALNMILKHDHRAVLDFITFAECWRKNDVIFLEQFHERLDAKLINLKNDYASSFGNLELLFKEAAFKLLVSLTSYRSQPMAYHLLQKYTCIAGSLMTWDSF